MINAKFLFFASNSSRETFLCGTVFFCLPGENNGSGSFFAPLIHSVSCHVTLYSLRYFIRMLLLTQFRFLLRLQFFAISLFFRVGWFLLCYRPALLGDVYFFLHAPALLFHTQIVCTYGDLNASNDIDWSPFKKSR